MTVDELLSSSDTPQDEAILGARHSVTLQNLQGRGYVPMP